MFVCSRIHTCSDVIGSCCGERGQAVYESVFTFVCGIPHPTLQLFYLSLIAFGYLLAVDTVYHQVNAFATAEMLAASSSASWASSLFSLDGCVRAMLALPFSWRVHFYAIPLIVDAGLITFLIVSFSDPGQVHEDNVKHFLDAYPRDGIVYTKQKECSTWYVFAHAALHLSLSLSLSLCVCVCMCVLSHRVCIIV